VPTDQLTVLKLLCHFERKGAVCDSGAMYSYGTRMEEIDTGQYKTHKNLKM
jgi:hypothetical protein